MDYRSASPLHDPEELMPKRSQLAWRALIACITGLMISGVCLYLGSQNIYSDVQVKQHFTRDRLRQFDKPIQDYYAAHHVYPKTLSQVAGPSDFTRDGWNQPLVYILKGRNYLLISYGADHKAGGSGLDCDLSSRNLFPPQSQLGFQEILAQPLSRNFEWGALVCGLLTTCLAFFSISAPELTRSGREHLLAKLAIILIAGAFVSLFITVLDLPLHH